MAASASRRLDSKRIVITGAAQGIGRAIAERFAAEGARLLLADIDGDKVAAVAAALGQQACRTDVAQKAEVEALIAAAVVQLGGLDVLVNNAGISAFCPIDDDDHYDLIWDRAVAVLLTAHQRLVRAALPHLRQSTSPRIVNIASTEALGATSRNSPYCAAKAGVTGLTRALAVELGKDGITVNCICPGPIDTGMTANVPDADKATFAHRRTALRRYGQPEEVAHMTLSLCLPAASFITGAVIPVDGGLMARNA